MKELQNLMKRFKTNGTSKIALFLFQREIIGNIDILKLNYNAVCIHIDRNFKIFYWCTDNNVLGRYGNFHLPNYALFR